MAWLFTTSAAEGSTYTATGTDGNTYTWMNNVWAPTGGPQTLNVNSNNNWEVISSQVYNTEYYVESYPAIIWAGSAGLNSYSGFVATHSAAGPGYGSSMQWETAFDIWLNASAPGASDGDEVMIWTDTSNVSPGATTETVTIAGVQYLYHAAPIGSEKAFIRVTNTPNDCVTDILAVLKWYVENSGNYSSGADPVLSSVEFGWEVWGTGGVAETFTCTGYTLDINGAGGGGTAPAAVTNAATAVAATGATLNGTVNPDSLATTYQFEYGPTTAYGTNVPASPVSAGSGSTAVAESYALTGLTASTTYHYRLIASNSAGTTDGSDQQFTTSAVGGGTSPSAVTNAASGVTAAAATLNGTVNPESLSTTYQFQYGLTTSYGTSVPATAGSAGSGSSAVAETYSLSGLAAGTTYHYRISATNSAGTTNGSDQSFTTSGGAPATITRGHASALCATGSVTSATVTWSANPAAGSKVLIGMAVSDFGAISSVIDNGTTPSIFTPDVTGGSSGEDTVYIYRADNITLPSSGSYTVTITMSPAEYVTAGGIAYTGVRPGGPTATNSGTGSAVLTGNTGSVTPAAAGALFFAVFTEDLYVTNEGITLGGTGWTEQYTEQNNETTQDAGIADQIASGGPAATSATWNWTGSSAWNAAIACYDAAGGGGSGGGGDFTPVGSFYHGTTLTPSLTTVTDGDLYLLGVFANDSAAYATGVSGGGCTGWTQMGPTYNGTQNTCHISIWAGTVSTAGSGALTVTMSGSSAAYRVCGQEFSCSTGSWALDTSGGVSTASGSAFPSLTPAAAGELYFSWSDVYDFPGAGSASGFTYDEDANGNWCVFSPDCTSSAQAPAFPSSTGFDAFAVLIKAAGTAALSGAAALSGSGTLGGTGIFSGAGYTLSGSGTLAVAGPDVLAPGSGAAFLSGSGTMTAGRGITWPQGVLLSGSGTLAAASAGRGQAALTGAGTLSSGLVLGYPVALSGTGSLSVLQVLGGLVSASAGASTPYAYPGTSQVAVAPPGSTAWAYLGSLGVITALTYSFTCPGGCDAMTCTVMVPAAYRTQMFNPGWQVRITRGGHQVWDGKLDEPVPTSGGWNLTAVGTGNRGTDFLAVYSDTWPANQPDESVNGAISRGLGWANPGVGTPSGAWYGQTVDSGAQTITALLNLICTRGGLTWMVNSQPGGVIGDDLSVFPLPSVVNRLLVCTTPVARTLGGDVNTIWIRYEISADTTITNSDGSTTSVPAAYGHATVQNTASVAAHGVMETYIDLSDAGVMSASAAASVGTSVLQIYQRASFAGPFTGSYGQLLTTGGQPIDPGTDQAGTYVRPILTDYGYGGEISPQLPVEFITGAYSWDDFAQQFSATPYVSVDASLTGLLSLANTEMTPITVASS